MSQRRVVAATLALSVLLAFPACSAATTTTPGPLSTPSTRTPPTTPAAPIVVNDPNSPIAVNLGQQFKIRVDLDPTKDARWQVDSYDLSTLFYLGESADQENSAPGAPVTDLLNFRADKQGSSKVILRFGLSGAGTSGDKRMTFSVVVS